MRAGAGVGDLAGEGQDAHHLSHDLVTGTSTGRSIVSSAYKRHGAIIEHALLVALTAAPHLQVWPDRFIRKSLRRPYSLVLVPFIAVVAAAGTSLSEEDSSTISRLLGEGVLGPALPADPIGEGGVT